jgi:nucleoside-diphosphate-sugar epimerase
MSTAAVTGGAGFIGGHPAGQLPGEGRRGGVIVASPRHPRAETRPTTPGSSKVNNPPLPA